MSDNFFIIVTRKGHEKIAASMAEGAKVTLSRMAFGDANGASYEPVETQDALKNECYRGDVTKLLQDEKNPYWFIVEAMIPDETGGFFIREVGLYDSDGDLFAVGKVPETYKPKLSSGSDKQIHFRLIFQISNSDNVNIVIDPSVIYTTKEYVDSAIGKAIGGIDWKVAKVATTAQVTLSGLAAVDGVTLVKGDRVLVKNQANARQNGIYVAATGAWQRAVDFKGTIADSFGVVVAVSHGNQNGYTQWILPLTGSITVGDDNITFYAMFSVSEASETVAGIVKLATPAEVAAGTNTTKAITPAGFKSQLNATVKDATETQKGIAQLATLAEATAGTNHTKIVTPAGVQAKIDATIKDASETQKGIAFLAKQAEVIAGTNTAKIVTPATLQAKLNATVKPATETVAGIAEIATLAEVKAGTAHDLIVTPKGLMEAMANFSIISSIQRGVVANPISGSNSHVTVDVSPVDAKKTSFNIGISSGVTAGSTGSVSANTFRVSGGIGATSIDLVTNAQGFITAINFEYVAFGSNLHWELITFK